MVQPTYELMIKTISALSKFEAELSLHHMSVLGKSVCSVRHVLCSMRLSVSVLPSQMSTCQSQFATVQDNSNMIVTLKAWCLLVFSSGSRNSTSTIIITIIIFSNIRILKPNLRKKPKLKSFFLTIHIHILPHNYESAKRCVTPAQFGLTKHMMPAC